MLVILSPASSFLLQVGAKDEPAIMTSFEDSLVAPGRTDDLSRVIEFIERACAAAGVEPAAWLDLQLATEEACANVIEHAYKDTRGSFAVSFKTRGRDVVITVHDHGAAFDPTRVPKPDLTVPLEDRPLGGLGLHLMQKLMDEVSFSFSPNEGNILVMTKRNVIAAEPGSDA